MDPLDRIIEAIVRVTEDNARLVEAGVKRDDPTTWRPDLIRPLHDRPDRQD